MVLFYSLAGVILSSLISILAAFFIGINSSILEKILKFLMSFAAGALLGDAFMHLLPEASETFGFTFSTSLFVLIGIITSFIIEKYIHWRHCHNVTSEHQTIHRLAKMNLVGDFVHNFLDGMIIAGSFTVSPSIGFSTTLAIILHEIPQEIGDYGVLLYSGVSKKKAMILNFLVSLSSALGVILTLYLNSFSANITPFIIPFAAGGFIYIACADLIPELHKESKIGSSFIQLGAFLLGIGVLSALLLLE